MKRSDLSVLNLAAIEKSKGGVGRGGGGEERNLI